MGAVCLESEEEEQPDRPEPRRGRKKRPARASSSAKWYMIGVGGLLLAVLVGVGVWALVRRDKGPEVPAGPTTIPVTPPGDSVPRGWQRFTPPGGGFTVALPGEPVATTTPIEALGQKVPLKQFTVQTTTTVFSVAYADVPGVSFSDSDVDKSLGSIAEGAMKNQEAPRLLEQRRIQGDGYPGAECIFESGPPKNRQLWVQRTFAVRSRLLMMLCRTPVSKDDTANRKLFLDSLRIEGK